jgi:aspartokinase-like uncharacterized kinase
MSGQSARVIKLGGSLLGDGEWPNRFRRWLERQPPMQNVLIVGGGMLADAVRGWDQVHGLSPSDAHWLAVDTMSVTSNLAAKVLSEARWTDEWQAVLHFNTADGCDSAPLIFNPRQFLKAIEPALDGERLPECWDITSDSIAARIAQLMHARELVLLKSCLPAKEIATLEQVSESDYVDRAFNRFAAELPQVRFVNLRDAEFPEIGWHRPASGCHRQVQQSANVADPLVRVPAASASTPPN